MNNMASRNNVTGTAMMTTMTSSTLHHVINTTSDYVISDEVKERIAVLSCIMACAVIGNVTLILILLCKTSRRIKRVNIFLINLAFGDLAVALFVNSTEILFLAFGDWVLGSILCKVMLYIQMVCLASATNLLTAMTLDRYQAIVKPMETIARRPRVLLKIAIAWALSLVFPIPQLFIFVQYEAGTKYDGTPKRICGSKGYTAPWQRKVYFTFTTIYILIIPMLIMLYCYAKIIHVVWVRARDDAIPRSSSKKQQQQHQQHHHQQHQQQTRKKNNECLNLPAVGEKSAKKSSPVITKNRSPLQTPRLTRKGSGSDSSSWNSGDKSVAIDASQLCRDGLRVHSSRQNSVTWTHNICQTPPDSNKAVSHPSTETQSANRKTPNHAVRISVRHNVMTSSKRRVLTMTLSVVMSFFICHTPYFVLTLIRIYSDYQIKMETGQVIGEFFVMIHSTLNPLLYGLFKLRQKHLKYLITLVACYKRRKRRGSNPAEESRGEMHCLLPRPNQQAPVERLGHSSNKLATPTKTPTINIRSRSPTSLSTSASSSSTSLTSSILSRFRRRKKSRKSAEPVKQGEREDSSIGDTLLYSNSDALAVSTDDLHQNGPGPSKENISKTNSTSVKTNHEKLSPESADDDKTIHSDTNLPEDIPSNRRLRDSDVIDLSVILTNPKTSVDTSEDEHCVQNDHPQDDKPDVNTEEDEVIHPVDFNSVPWEDEFIIGGLTRV